MYHLTKTLDSTRPVIGNDGWESSATDIIGIHDYNPDPEHIRVTYGEAMRAEELFDRRRPVALLQADPRVYGARLTGAGFGGTCVALCRPQGLGEAAAAVLDAYTRAGFAGRQVVPHGPKTGDEP